MDSFSVIERCLRILLCYTLTGLSIWKNFMNSVFMTEICFQGRLQKSGFWRIFKTLVIAIALGDINCDGLGGCRPGSLFQGFGDGVLTYKR